LPLEPVISVKETVAAILYNSVAKLSVRTRDRNVIFKLLAVAGLFGALISGHASRVLKKAPPHLSLQVAGDPAGAICRHIEIAEHVPLTRVAMHLTFHDDFNDYPLADGQWTSHYAGGAAWPDARYWGGDGSDFKRKTNANGEQQIYVDSRYAGRGSTPLGLDPFKVKDGVLSIVATRTPPEFKPVLFDNEYISGILTTQNSFAQKYGYFEIRAKVPVGNGVWPAFWLLANDGGWPPELDVMEGRGEEPGAIAMTTHWRHPDTQKIESCEENFTVATAPGEFHNYGALWERDRITYFIDRKPVADIKVPVGFDDPMYMIINLAMGAKWFKGVGFVDAESPDQVAFQIDRVSVYQIDSY
jgi:beta-glucanase (GH16 family)